MVRRYTLEQEEFVRKRLDAKYQNSVIRDEYQAKFPESHAESPFELNQVSYLRKKNKEGSLGFRNPGFRQLVASINEKRAANGQPPLGDPAEPEEDEEDEEEDDEEDEEASDDAAGSPQAPQNVAASNAARPASSAVTTAAFRPALAPAQTSTPLLGTQASVQAQTQVRFDPHAASNPNAASASVLPTPSDGSVPNPLTAQMATFRQSAQESQRPNDVIEPSRAVAPSSASKGETSATDKPDTARPTQERERDTRKTDDMARGVPGPNTPRKEQRSLPVPARSGSVLEAFHQAHEPTLLSPFAIGDFHPGMRNASAADSRPQGTINPRQLTKSPGAATGTPSTVFWAAAPDTRLAPNAAQHLNHTETSPLLGQTDADGTLGKRKNTSPTPKPAATGENGEKRPKLSQNQPDSPSYPAGAVEPDELGRMSLPFVLGDGRWPSSSAQAGNQSAPDQSLPEIPGSHSGFVNISKAFFPARQSGGNGEAASHVKKLQLHVGKDGLATVQSPGPASTGSHTPLPKPTASAHVGSLQPAAAIPPTRQPAGHTGHHGMLPIPTVRDFKRSAGSLTINSGFPSITGQQQTHQGSGQTADAVVLPSGGKAQARQEADALVDMIEGQDLIEAAIQAGKDAQNMIFSNRDPNSGNHTRESKALLAMARVQEASVRLNKVLYPTLAESPAPAMRVTSTPQGPVVEQAPQHSEEDAEVYYVTMPIPGTDVRPCPVGADCPVPASVFHFHCHVNKTVIFSDTDDFKRAAMVYVKAQQERLLREQ
ncbi:hypothetical protein MAPG_08491 [Magnaporthiopsis poae ATCC 64411]|uniref:Uncharacterized protein n=1 Tax=Magnaporthiopsis poae (strain ATCC 64411 / 73-15) TaxID=644358 RepID=A0A0C4E7H8_MAGP6|nr:hypothetical protein MAPG_08491 [Magnaporthiopsis poae ATCC 64411]